MAAGFDKSTLTLAVNTAQQLSGLLVAQGYTGSLIGSFLELEDVNSLGNVFHGGSSAVSSANGRALTIYNRASSHPSLPVDPSRIWLISATGGNIACTFEPY